MNNDVSIHRSINGIDYDFHLTMSEMVAIYNEVSHRNMVSDIRQRLYERQEVNGYSFEELRTDEFMNAVAEVYDEEAHAQGGILVVLRSKIADARSAKRKMLQRDCLQSLRQLLAGYRQSH